MKNRIFFQILQKIYINEDWEDFSKPKIMYSEIVSEPQFFIDNTGQFYPEATSFILVGKHLEYIWGILNSNIYAFFFKKFYAGGGLGETGYRYKKQFILKLPVPKLINNPLDSKTIISIYNLSDEEYHYIIQQMNPKL